MRSDRCTKALLAAIALGVWALTMVQAGTSVDTVHASSPLYSAQAQETSSELGYTPKTAAPVVRAAASSLPLRWRVRHAILRDTGDIDCFTVVSVRNLATSSTSVQVEWLTVASSSMALQSLTLAAGAVGNFTVWKAGNSTNFYPFVMDEAKSVSGDFGGSAQVHASDPRVSVAAFLRCDTAPADQDPNSINSIPCDPVGATMEFFQAGMPATWTPPMAEPEVPE